MRLHFAIPGDLNTPTGGYGYDRRLIAALGRRGWDVRHMRLPGTYPFPDAEARAAAAAAFAAVPDGERVLIDGLGGGVLPEVLAAEAGRLRIAALVHHPLADETGLTPDEASRLARSERAALAAVGPVIVPSGTTAARLVAGFGVCAARITVAPPGTEPGERAARAGDPPLIVSIGSLTPRKRHDVLIAALTAVADRPWRARIVGAAHLDPACAADLRRRMEAADLSGRLELLDTVADARAELAAADLFALASEYEGYGMAFAEALSHGLPVVGARCDAVADLVPEAAGALVPVGDSRAFALALAGLLDDRERRDAAAEAAWAAGRRLPDWPETAARLAEALA